MKNINEIKNCYGCFACMSKCPKQCISLIKDKLGHIYPHANNNNCIECNACINVCPIVNELQLNKPTDVYAAVGKNCKIIEKSSSGGIATLLSERIINYGGVVYGCAVQNKIEFRHIRCDRIEDLEKIKGSKYVHSDISTIYKDVNNDLKLNKKVLFIGTPCQVAALKSYFKDNSNLYTIDLICHGVPSSKIFKESLPSKFINEEIDSISFRSKDKYQISLYKNNKLLYTRPLSKDLYLKGFFTSLFNRNSCFSCKFTKRNRIGDISLGDFWGLKDTKFKNFKGISLCLINTNKGKNLFTSIYENIISSPHSIEEASKNNKPLNHPSPKTLSVNIFQKIYPVGGFKLAVILSIPGIIIKNIIKKDS